MSNSVFLKSNIYGNGSNIYPDTGKTKLTTIMETYHVSKMLVSNLTPVQLNNQEDPSTFICPESFISY